MAPELDLSITYARVGGLAVYVVLKKYPIRVITSRSFFRQFSDRLLAPGSILISWFILLYAVPNTNDR